MTSRFLLPGTVGKVEDQKSRDDLNRKILEAESLGVVPVGVRLHVD